MSRDFRATVLYYLEVGFQNLFRMEILFMKTLTTSLTRLSIYDLRREEILTPGRFVTWRWSRQGKVFASLRFIVGEDRLTICDSDRRPLYDITMTKMNCYLGGSRF